MLKYVKWFNIPGAPRHPRRATHCDGASHMRIGLLQSRQPMPNKSPEKLGPREEMAGTAVHAAHFKDAHKSHRSPTTAASR